MAAKERTSKNFETEWRGFIINLSIGQYDGWIQNTKGNKAQDNKTP